MANRDCNFITVQVAVSATGKMYKRYTFGHLALTRNSCGVRQQIIEKKMKVQRDVRNKMIVIRVSPKEHGTITAFQKKTTERNLSTYIRKLALAKPLIIKYRNESADHFLQEMLELKKDLSGIANNFNQAVKKLHILEKIPEFRNWIHQYDNLHQGLIAKLEQIKLHMQQVYEKWSLE